MSHIRIIAITSDTAIRPERAYYKRFDQTTMVDLRLTPQTAREVFGPDIHLVKRGLYHETSQSYAFTHDHAAYRAEMPRVLYDTDAHPHWQTCKRCRQEFWCAEGQRLIDGALGSAREGK